MLIDGRIADDETLPSIIGMAVGQARAGADRLAPFCMMDGRVAAIREALDEAGFTQVGILSYCVKYASPFHVRFEAPRAACSVRGSGDTGRRRTSPLLLPFAGNRRLLNECRAASRVTAREVFLWQA